MNYVIYCACSWWSGERGKLCDTVKIKITMRLTFLQWNDRYLHLFKEKIHGTRFFYFILKDKNFKQHWQVYILRDIILDRGSS